MSKTSRRNFVITAGMTSGAAVIAGIQSNLLSVAHNSDHSAVSKLISQYGVKLNETHKDDGSVEYQVKVRDHSKLAQSLSNQKQLPWDQIRVTKGNTLELIGKGQILRLRHIA